MRNTWPCLAMRYVSGLPCERWHPVATMEKEGVVRASTLEDGGSPQGLSLPTLPRVWVVRRFPDCANQPQP